MTWTMRPGIFAATLICGMAAAASAAAQIVIDRTTAILLPADEAPAVVAAAQDLASDFEKVFGLKARVVHRREEAGPTAIVIGSSPGDPESFSISARERDVVLAGPDVRGKIYAIYDFAERYLGVDPLYYWTDHDPARKARIEIPSSLDESVRAPLFKYRGFFINDEDLLTGWAPGEAKDHTGISLAAWDRIYETILRLKGNIVAPGTWIFPDEPQIALAGRRGLIVTQHHAIPLGVNVARWPERVPYSYTSNPEILQRAWTNAVAAYPRDQEVLWTVGLRGLSDSSYASYDPSVQSDTRAQGRVIGAAMAEQARIVRAVHPDASFITNLWQEGAGLVQRGELTLPEGVHAVWADDGYGNLQDGGRVAAGQGAYYHVAMMNGRANQLTEMVPVERIYSELGRYIAAGATHYVLVNVSDIRPVPMTIRALMETAWKGRQPGQDGSASAFYRRWAADQFGTRAAAKVADLYEAYFKAPARLPGTATREYGDQLYHTESRRMILTQMLDAPLFSIPSQAPPWMPPRRLTSIGTGGAALAPKESLRETVKTQIERTTEAQPRWDAVWQMARAAQPLVAADRQPFYRAHVLTMIAINRESNRMLGKVARAIDAANGGRNDEARRLLGDAVQACDEIRRAKTAAEYGRWKNWYAGDWLTNVNRTRETIALYAQHLADPMSPLPSPLLWDWEAYYHILQYEGDRTVDVRAPRSTSSR
jgi:hypothetical protein